MENLGFGKVLLVEDDEKLAGLIAEANGLLAPHGARADMLKALASYVATREN